MAGLETFLPLKVNPLRQLLKSQTPKMWYWHQCALPPGEGLVISLTWVWSSVEVVA